MIRVGLPWRLLLIGLLLSVAAAPRRQFDATPIPDEVTDPFAPPLWLSPTPDASGAIIVIVQPGDSMWGIAARADITLADLFAFNGLTEGSIISPGDALIVGYATPELTVPEVITPTATLPPPTPQLTATPAQAAICLSAFDDLNRNGIREPNEALRAGVAFTLYNTQAVVANYITDGRSEPKCVRGLTPGEYRITRSVLPGETLTTSGDWTLTLSAGGELNQAFGSFLDEIQAATPFPAPGWASGTPTETALAATATPPVSGFDSFRNIGWGLAGVGVLFMGGLILLGAVLILLIRQVRSALASQPPPENDE